MAPVLDLDEVASHPHNMERETFLEIEGILQPAPAPRLYRTPGFPGANSAAAPEQSQAILSEMGYTDDAIKHFIERSIVE